MNRADVIIREANGDIRGSHGGLQNLAADDHAQYFNEARGDLRYYTRAEAERPPYTKLFYEADFLEWGIYANPPWLGGSIASGTRTSILGLNDHPGIVRFRAATGNDSGYQFSDSTNGYIISGTEKSVHIFKVADAAAGISRARLGFLGGVVVADPANGIWFYYDQDAGTIDGRSRSASGTVAITATALAYTNDTWYRGEIAVNAANNLITFTIYLCSTGAVVWTDTVATIPAVAVGHGAMAWNTAPVSARDILYIDYMSVGITRTLVR